MTEKNSDEPVSDLRDPQLTGMIERPVQRLEPASSAYDLPVTLETEVEEREPLFNKKVMAAWAVVALAAWIAVKFIGPVVFETTKASIKEAVRQGELESGNRGTPGTIRIERNGRVITIQTDRRPPTVAPPVVAPAPVIPDAEAGSPLPPKPAPATSAEPVRR